MNGLEVALGGLVVGLLVGLTGIGGGLIMTPLMIFVFGMSPKLAVGTDLVYSCITKLIGFLQHRRQDTVDMPLAKTLMIGSVPGALAGVALMGWVNHLVPANVLNMMIGRMLGVTYLLVGALMLVRFVRRHKTHANPPKKRLLIPLSFVMGVIVGLTSVGSGSLFMAALALLYPMGVARLIGTDMFQSILVTGVAGLAHAALHNVNFVMVGELLIGSIPGILFGSRLVAILPDRAIRFSILVLLFLTGAKMLAA